MDILSVAITPLILLGAWITGTVLERRHMKSLRLLESGARGVLAITIEDFPPEWRVESCELVMGNVVISQDYFKRVAATIKGIFGGNIRAFEPLLERARREALIRMKGVAHARGYDTIVNVRLETATLASSRSDGKGTAGVEILAYGTAILLADGHRDLDETYDGSIEMSGNNIVANDNFGAGIQLTESEEEPDTDGDIVVNLSNVTANDSRDSRGIRIEEFQAGDVLGRIVRGTFDHNDSDGVRVESYDGGAIDLLISGTAFTDNRGDGLQAEGKGTITLVNPTFGGNGDDDINDDGVTVTILGR